MADTPGLKMWVYVHTNIHIALHTETCVQAM